MAPAARGQEPRPSVEERKPPALLVRPDPEKPSLPLRVVAAKVDVLVLGNIAATTLDLTFQNDTTRVLEGQLVLPLPPGATISSLALEFDGKLRRASVVEREKARVVFEEVVRRGVDPGLVEWVKGNVFQTRVYPIPAKGTKRVVLGWDEPVALGADGASSYRLPLGFGSNLDALEANVVVRGAGEIPEPAADALPLDFQPKGIRSLPAEFRGTFSVKDTKPLDLAFHFLPLPRTFVLVEPARVKPAVGKSLELVWVAQVPVPKIDETAKKTGVPKHVTVLWDASGSSSGRDHAKERAFLEAYLAQLGDAEARLVVFSNDVWEPGEQVFAVKAGKCPEILAKIDAIRPDGGTRFSCLDLKKIEANCDAFLLFSDGLATFGEGDPVFGTKPVTCVASGPTLDLSALDRFARGGALVNLNTISPGEGADRALEPPLVFLFWGFKGDNVIASENGGPSHGTRVDEFYPNLAGTRVSGSVFTVAGRLSRGKPIEAVAHFGRGGKVLAKSEFTLDPDSGTETGRVERIWAAKKIESLSTNASANESEIVATAKAHGIVTPFTSLLVLDRLDDYVRYRVTPPEEMREEWEKRIEAEKAAKSKETSEILESLRQKWKARVEWWKKEFTYPADFHYTEPQTKKGDGRGRAHSGGGDRAVDEEAPEQRPAPEPDGAPRPQAPPPPSPAQGEGANLSAGAPGAHSKAAEESGAGGESPSSITLKSWDPKTPYLEAWKSVKDPAALYSCYLDQRAKYLDSTAFFLDAADYFYAQKQRVLAVRILSNIAEMKLESAPLLRILAYRLEQGGSVDLAIEVFRAVTKIRPEEPQSWRDLGLALAEAKQWREAVANLEKVVLGRWDARFPDIEVIALGELNETLARAKTDTQEKLTSLPDDLLDRLDTDLRIILTWDADACDMDLWVTEPSGEKAFYGHTSTTIGGAFGKDFTQGYGPEEYLLKKAMPGTYKIQVNYYGNHQQILAGATTIQVLVIKNYGRPNEERIAVTRRLQDNKEVLDVADVAFGK
jgi:tetratricopeptide (TPR) repeat protein